MKSHSTQCPENNLGFSKAPEEVPKEAFFCTLPEEKPEQILELRHENDLNFIEGLKYKTGLGQTLSDDVGRTAGFFGRYDQKTSVEHKYIELRSDGFGQQVQKNGKYQDATGKYYLQFLEIDQLTLGKKQVLSSDERSSTSQDLEAQVELRTGRTGIVVQPIQEAWHKATEPKLQYNYVDGEAQSVTASVAAGMTKIIKADLGQFQCTGTGTALIGIDTQGRAILENRMKLELEKGELGSNSILNPWWAISMWRNDRMAGQEFRSETGVKFSTGWKTNNGLVVKPYYGIVRYRSEDDRVYSLGSRGGEEPIHMIGLIVQFK